MIKWLFQSTTDGATYLQSILMIIASITAIRVFIDMVINDLPEMAGIKNPPAVTEGSKRSTYKIIQY